MSTKPASSNVVQSKEKSWEIPKETYGDIWTTLIFIRFQMNSYVTSLYQLLPFCLLFFDSVGLMNVFWGINTQVKYTLEHIADSRRSGNSGLFCVSENQRRTRQNFCLYLHWMGKPVQAYQRKCFRVVLLWNLENFIETDSDRDTPPGVVYCWSSADIIRRVWGIGRIHVSKGYSRTSK